MISDGNGSDKKSTNGTWMFAMNLMQLEEDD
jgi:hypothetical protein